jgi:AcrR family transcriptional regulator
MPQRSTNRAQEKGSRPGARSAPGSEAVQTRVADVSFADLSTRAKIREVALRLFVDGGIRATSIRAVAAAAGVSPSLVVHHFQTKDGLESAVHQDVIARIRNAVQGTPTAEPIASALLGRKKAFATLLQDQPYLADYLFRVLSEGNDASIDFFRQSLETVRSEMTAMVDAGLARQFDDPEVGIALYWVLVNARFLLRPHLEAVLGLDLSKPEDLDRLDRAEIDLCTRPLFPEASLSPESSSKTDPLSRRPGRLPGA